MALKYLAPGGTKGCKKSVNECLFMSELNIEIYMNVYVCV